MVSSKVRAIRYQVEGHKARNGINACELKTPTGNKHVERKGSSQNRKQKAKVYNGRVSKVVLFVYRKIYVTAICQSVYFGIYYDRYKEDEL